MSKAVHMAFFMEGLHDAGYSKILGIVGNEAGIGCIEMVVGMEQYADYLEALTQKADTILDEHYPGVLDYEVSSFFGSWYGRHIIEKSVVPEPEQAKQKLLETTLAFFMQGVGSEVAQKLSVELSAV